MQEFISDTGVDFVKKFFAIILFALLIIPAATFAKPLTVISLGADKAGNENAAVEKMKMAAVGHVLAFIIPPNPDPNGDFVNIVKTHYKEVALNPKVSGRKKDGSGIRVTGEVTVDFDKLRQIVRSQIQGLQNENIDEPTVFFVRITGVNDLNLKQKAFGDVLKTYGAVFENLGFKVENSDELTAELSASPDSESFEAFCLRMNEEAGNTGCMYAVIGEIALKKISEGETGIIWESTARLQARSYGSNAVGGTLIFQFDDDYKLKGRDDNIAFFALRKAALNSSRALAEHTLDYWKKH